MKNGEKNDCACYCDQRNIKVLVDFIVLFCFPVHSFVFTQFFFSNVRQSKLYHFSPYFTHSLLITSRPFLVSFEGNFQNLNHISTILTATYLVKFPVRQKPSIIPLNIRSLDVSNVIVVDINEVSSINMN